MLFRFSLYGFLKNQKYYEPFLILFFLNKGLSFFQIGLLVAFREFAVTVMEVPSGALADSFGRRITMALSMAGYIISFMVFSFSKSFSLLFTAMFFFAVGDAFRTGTHKAMIFKWLENSGSLSEKTRVYGYTRSWSKAGTALSSIIAAALVWKSGAYSSVFLFCIPPYVLNLVNLLSYPKDLEGEESGGVSLRGSWEMLKSTLRDAATFKPLRSLIGETMGYEGVHKVTSDYVQPVIQAMALSLPFLAVLSGDRGSASLAGGVYFLLAMIGIFGARLSHRLVRRAESEHRAASLLWTAALLVYLLMIPALLKETYLLVILLFLGLELLQNLWRPLQVGRFDEVSRGSRRATVLSIESQAKSLSAMVYAPILGFLVDRFGLWTAGAAGAIVAVVALWLRRNRNHDSFAETG